MLNCTSCRDLLWDHLYGLLEAGEEETLRLHVSACSACRKELQQAEAEQRLLGQVARLDIDVPLFVAPTPDTLPMRKKIGFPVGKQLARHLPWAAAAAAALVMVVLPYGLYRAGLARHEAAVAAAQKQLLESQAQRAELQTRTAAERDKIVHDAKSSQLRVQVLGPSQYLAETPNAYRVLTSDLEGKAVPARLSARLVGSNNRVLFESNLDSAGDLLVALPSLKLEGDTSAQLQILAAARESREEVQGRLNAGEPVYARRCFSGRSRSTGSH
jgi:hypothetical protein